MLVNRLWSWIVGRGLVATVDNFGTTGEAPSHPELLDYLASDFMARGWSAKDAIRQIVLSSTYRRSTIPTERSIELDPDNRLLSHAVRKRLEVEAMRDSMLSISGELSVPGPGATLKAGAKEDYRYTFAPNLRAVYQPVLRNSTPELYEAFDFPNSSISTGQRTTSVVSPQALAMMNNSWVHSRAEMAAKDFLKQHPEFDAEDSPDNSQWEEVVKLLFEECVGRPPTLVELYTSLTLIDELKQQPTARAKIIQRLIHGLFGSLDFRYLE